MALLLKLTTGADAPTVVKNSMRTINKKIYKFDELSDKAKEKARDWYREADDLPMLSDYLDSQLEEALAHNKITADKPPKISYSLGYCQGDGAMFEGVVHWGKFTAKIKHSGHYYHYNSKEIDLTVTENGEEAEEVEYAAFNELYISICRELEREGYNYIEEERSAERVDENIIANDYEFDEDGRIYSQ